MSAKYSTVIAPMTPPKADEVYYFSKNVMDSYGATEDICIDWEDGESDPALVSTKDFTKNCGCREADIKQEGSCMRRSMFVQSVDASTKSYICKDFKIPVKGVYLFFNYITPMYG